MANTESSSPDPGEEDPGIAAPGKERHRPGWLKWALGGVVAVVVLAVGVPFVYINFIEGDPPAKLTLETGSGSDSESGTDGSTTTIAAPVTLDGNWDVGSGSTAGYRVDETLVGQSTTAVGRTNDVTGTFTLQGATVPSGSFTVNMASVSSDQSRRDNQFRRLLGTDSNPNATFVITQPIDLGSVPAEGAVATATATGDLTLNGQTKSVEIPLQVRRTGGTVEVLGSLTVRFDDYGIENPSFGPAQVGDEGTLEFLLRFNKTGDSTTTTVPATTLPQAGEGPITPPSTTQAPLGL